MKLAIVLGTLSLWMGGPAFAGSMPVGCHGKNYDLLFEHGRGDVWSPLPVDTTFTEQVDRGPDKTIKVIGRTNRRDYLAITGKELVALYFGFKNRAHKKHVLVYQRESGEVLELISCSK